MYRFKLPGRLSGMLSLGFVVLGAAVPDPELVKARDQQNLPALDSIIARYKKDAESNGKVADAQYKSALAYSYAAEVALELRDKKKSGIRMRLGLESAKKAVAGNELNAEYHRLLGALCGQVIPANPILGALSYGSCARDEIDKAIGLDSHLSLVLCEPRRRKLLSSAADGRRNR